MRRGEIWWADMGSPRGSEPGFRRPVVIVQADGFNRSRIQTVIAAAITSNEKLGSAPGNVPLTRRQSGLRKDSVINVTQLLTLDRFFLTERVKTLPVKQREALDEGLRLVLDL